MRQRPSKRYVSSAYRRRVDCPTASSQVSRDEAQQRVHTASLPRPGVSPDLFPEKIDEERWEEIIRNLEVEVRFISHSQMCEAHIGSRF